jgi:hypothetical protein
MIFMADETKELLIKISATTELLRSQLASAERSVAQFEGRTNASLTKVDGGFARLNKSFGVGKAALAGFVGGLTSGLIGQLGQIPGALSRAAQSGLEYASSLGEQAQALGVGTRFMQEFRFAVEQNGGTLEDADNALGKFSVNLGKAFDGGKQAGDAFKRLGLDLNQLKAASDSERFEMVADAIARIKDPAQLSASSVAVFGKGARAIIPTLQAGAAGFRDQAAAARELGLILSDEQIQNADKTADKIQALNRALQAKIAGAVADNASAIGSLTNALVKLGSEAVTAASRYLNFRRISTLSAGGAGTQDAANDLLSTKEGRNQLYNSIVDRQRRGVLVDGVATITSPQQRERNRQILEGQRQAVIRAEVAARRLDAARARAGAGRPPAVSSVVDTPARSGGAGSSGRGGSRVSALKKDAEETLPSLQEIRDLLNDIDIDPTGSPQTRISQAFGGGENFLQEALQERDRRREIDQELENEKLQRGEETFRTLSGLYEDVFRRGTGSIWENFKSIGNSVISDVLAKFTISTIAGKSVGGLSGILTSSLTSLGFGGFFAGGGQPPLGKVSVVGERGPELFVPRIAGSVIPNHALGGQQIVVHVAASEYFDARVERVSVGANLPIMRQVGQAAMVGGASEAQRQLLKKSSRRLGR